MDMTKISMCKEQDGETVSQYLTHLIELHNVHSGLENLPNMTDADLKPYEAHLINFFLSLTF